MGHAGPSSRLRPACVDGEGCSSQHGWRGGEGSSRPGSSSPPSNCLLDLQPNRRVTRRPLRNFATLGIAAMRSPTRQCHAQGAAVERGGSSTATPTASPRPARRGVRSMTRSPVPAELPDYLESVSPRQCRAGDDHTNSAPPRPISSTCGTTPTRRRRVPRVVHRPPRAHRIGCRACDVLYVADDAALVPLWASPTRVCRRLHRRAGAGPWADGDHSDALHRRPTGCEGRDVASETFLTRLLLTPASRGPIDYAWSSRIGGPFFIGSVRAR